MTAITASGNATIDALAELSWLTQVTKPVTLTYSFASAYTGSTNLTATQRQNTLLALEAWSNVANITFTEVKFATGNIDFGFGDLSHEGEGVQGIAYIETTNDKITHTEIVLDDSMNQGFAVGSRDYTVLLHEIGHALGLKHPFEGAKQLTGYNDSSDFTLMSYTSGTYTSASNPSSPQIADVKAIQYLYGKNTGYHGGISVVTMLDTDTSTASTYTLWDGGGRDYLDGRGNTAAITLDLREGIDYVNIIGTDTIWVAEGATIENALAGTGNDTVYGGTAANQIFGGRGADDLYGDTGNDTIVGGMDFVDLADGADIIYGNAGDDIIYGNSGNDTIYGGSAQNDASETGNDILYDGLGTDKLYGNGGNDTLVSSYGDDTLYGGSGDDVFVLTSSNGVDWIYPFEGAGETGGDILRILHNINGTGIRTAEEVVARSTSDTEHTWINLGSGNGVLLLHTGGEFTVDDVLII